MTMSISAMVVMTAPVSTIWTCMSRRAKSWGIVGARCGKTTMVNRCFCAHTTWERGAVRVDGHDVRQVTQESLRRNIAMVTQETAMFNRSRDNILYGRPDATEAEVIAAATAAEAQRLHPGLRDHAGRTGYDAHLAKRGVKLSGGSASASRWPARC